MPERGGRRKGGAGRARLNAQELQFAQGGRGPAAVEGVSALVLRHPVGRGRLDGHLCQDRKGRAVARAGGDTERVGVMAVASGRTMGLIVASTVVSRDGCWCVSGHGRGSRGCHAGGRETVHAQQADEYGQHQ